ncbi:hypothetical protein BY457_104233 [Marinilabilia salmonicolor]|jgi:hypothetical protein|uniref:hypothetical protein n=1 Tax=Marinilabilia salmonicolor TaxID=989 RepID=UPI000D0528DE|nr:hypothetical protein [Marinilabilia salmonicolor]PRZ01033.1 hypothetical protein BY457_104233 [Marinilabilia salmonicolor]
MNSKFLFPCTTVLTILYLTLFSFQNVSAQENSTTKSKLPETFLGAGFGINDYGIGVGLEQAVSNNFSVYGTGGLSTWGLRATGGLSWYLKEGGFGSSISMGISYSSGMEELETTLETSGYISGYGEYGGYGYQPIEENDKEVTLDLFAYSTINLLYSYNLKVGTRSKFVFSGGFSIPLEDNVYRVKSGHLLTNNSKRFINFMAPGGIIIGVKFMLGIDN